MVSADSVTLMGLSGMAGGVALLLGVGRKGSLGRVTELFILLAAGMFGMAMGLRALQSEMPLPLPAGIRFVGTAAFGSLAFHRSCRWIQDGLKDLLGSRG